MDSPVSRYRVAHHNARRLLDVFANQLHAFEQGRMPDMLLMRDIFACLNRYVAIGDNTYESELIEALTQTDNCFAPARLVLTTEHAAITELGRRCLALIEDMLDGVMVSRSELLTPGKRYLRIYRAHLKREQSYIQRYQCETEGSAAGYFAQSLPEEPIEEFTDLCERITQAVKQLETDDFGLSVCAACGTDSSSIGGGQSLWLGS